MIHQKYFLQKFLRKLFLTDHSLKNDSKKVPYSWLYFSYCWHPCQTLVYGFNAISMGFWRCILLKQIFLSWPMRTLLDFTWFNLSSALAVLYIIIIDLPHRIGMIQISFPTHPYLTAPILTKALCKKVTSSQCGIQNCKH